MKFVELPILDIVAEAEGAYTIVLGYAESEPFEYSAGQYLTVELTLDGQSVRRAFSLSSSPAIDQQLAITIKRIPNGLVSNHLGDHLGVGDTLRVAAPRGSFTFVPQAQYAYHYILIGGGSGITPLMSMLKTILEGEPQSIVSLWYGNRTFESIIFYDQLGQLSAQYPERLNVLHALTQPDESWKGYVGRMDEGWVYDRILQLFMVDEYYKKFYICGPEGMMNAAQAALDRHAVHPANVYREYYHAPEATADVEEAAEPAPTPVPTWETQDVNMEFEGAVFQIETLKSETILDAALREGLDPPYSCLGGTCSSCKARLLTGEVYMERDWGLSEQEVAEGYILTCQAHPLDDTVCIRWDAENG